MQQLGSGTTIAAIAWDKYQARTHALATALGGRAFYLRSRPVHPFLVPVRYLIDGVRTWLLLGRCRPRVLLAITPPVFPPLIVWLWCATHGASFVVDCHTGALHSWRWRWSDRLLRPACRRALATLVHTHGDEEVIRSWGAVALLVPDELPDPTLAAPPPRRERPCVVVAGSLDGNEPVEAAIEAAGLIPDVEVRFTGDQSRVPARIRRAAAPNVVFTGWLRYPEFLAELLAADVVAVFSTDPFIMNRAAFEAIGLGRPLVLSDLAGLRSRFGPAAMFSANQPSVMAGTLREALAQTDLLAARSVELQAQLRMQHQQAIARLTAILQAREPTPPTELSSEAV